MHEIGITQNVVAIVAEYANGAKVRRVLSEIGKLSAIMPYLFVLMFVLKAQF